MAEDKKNAEKIGLKERVLNRLARLSLSTRLLFRLLPFILLLSVVFAGATVAIDRIYTKKITEEKTKMLMDIIMAAATDPIITEDEAVLSVLAAQAVDRDNRINKIMFFDEEGKVLAENVFDKQKKGLVETGRDLVVGGESFGGFKVWIDYSDIPELLELHDKILAITIVVLFLFTIPMLKFSAKKYYQQPLGQILKRIRFALGESADEAPPLSGLHELVQLEPYMDQVKSMKARVVQVEDALQKMLAENEKLKKRPEAVASKEAEKMPSASTDNSPKVNEQVTPANGYLPDSEAVLGLIKDLLGREVTVKETDKLILPSKKPLYIATYIDASNNILELIFIDVPFAAYSGAALAMMPVGVCKEAIKAKKAEGELLGNAREVLNIGASLFNQPDSTHVKLAEVYLSSEEYPQFINDFLASNPPMSLGLEFDIADYGVGHLSIYARNIEAKAVVAGAAGEGNPDVAAPVEEIAPTKKEEIMPDASEWAVMISDLVGKEVEGNDLENWDEFKEEGAYLASFINPEGDIKKLLISDLTLSASLGAALAMLSPALVKECLDQKALNEEISGNLREIFNIAAASLNKSNDVAVKLSDMVNLKSDLPENLTKALESPVISKAACHLNIPGYGDGKLLLLLI